jgi:predicted nuclease of restriction endonuclease-like (RecB) superfamily
MTKPSSARARMASKRRGVVQGGRRPSLDAGGRFDEVLSLIEAARHRAYQAVNAELVGLYWELGEYISRKLAAAEWGDAVVDDLAAAIAREYPGMRGYTRRNLFRMRQFYEAYRDDEKVSPLVTLLPWTHHLIIFSQVKLDEERRFYIAAAVQSRWAKRELERQIRTHASRRRTLGSKRVGHARADPPVRSRRVQERVQPGVPRSPGWPLGG